MFYSIYLFYFILFYSLYILFQPQIPNFVTAPKVQIHH